MGKRAAIALRLIAVIVALDVARQLAFRFWRTGIVDQLRAGGHQSELIAQLAFVTELGRWSHAALALVWLGATLVYAFSLSAGRRVALVGAVALVVHAAMMVAAYGAVDDPIPFAIKLSWFVDGVSLTLAALLPLLAAHLALRVPLTRLGVIAAGVVGCFDLAISGYMTFGEVFTPIVQWSIHGLALVIAGVVLAFGLPAANRLAGAAASEAPRAVGKLDGTPLRALGWSLLLRIALGLLIQIAIVLALKDANFDSAGTLTGLGGALSVLLGIVIVGALVAYLRYPETHRSDAVGLVIGLVVLGAILDVVAASAGVELFGMAAEAKRATSFWGMPSLSKIEQLQSTLTWVGRAAVVVGVLASFALASSLLATARVAGDATLVQRAGRVRILIAVAGASAIGLGFLLQAARGDGLLLFALFALVLLAVAVFLLVDWARLLFGLAEAVERERPELAAESST